MSEATNSPALARKKDKVIGSHVVVEDNHSNWGKDDDDTIASNLNDKFSDSVSLKNYSAYVAYQTTPVCSLCEADWDPVVDDESGVLCCENCGVPVAEKT